MSALPLCLRRAGAWIALLGLVLATLAPTLSHALGSPAKAGWVEVCTAAGMKWVNDDGRVSDTTPEGMAASLDCPCCQLQHTPALPAAQLFVLPVGVAAGMVFPAAFYAAPHRLHAWCTASPRAPPSAA